MRLVVPDYATALAAVAVSDLVTFVAPYFVRRWPGRDKLSTRDVPALAPRFPIDAVVGGRPPPWLEGFVERAARALAPVRDGPPGRRVAAEPRRPRRSPTASR